MLLLSANKPPVAPPPASFPDPFWHPFQSPIFSPQSSAPQFSRPFVSAVWPPLAPSLAVLYLAAECNNQNAGGRTDWCNPRKERTVEAFEMLNSRAPGTRVQYSTNSTFYTQVSAWPPAVAASCPPPPPPPPSQSVGAAAALQGLQRVRCAEGRGLEHDCEQQHQGGGVVRGHPLERAAVDAPGDAVCVHNRGEAAGGSGGEGQRLGWAGGSE